MATTSRSADDDADNFQRDDMPSSAAVVKHRGWVYRMWHKLGLDVLTMQKMLKLGEGSQSGATANLTQGFNTANNCCCHVSNDKRKAVK